MSFRNVQIQDLSASDFDALVARLRHYDGLSLAPDGNGFKATGDGGLGRLVHDPATNTLTVELHEISSPMTPGLALGRLYDEILNS